MTEKIDSLDCVLLIDDDEATNFFHKIIIEDEWSELFIESVPSAKAALDFLLNDKSTYNRPKPGIIFLDINMPGMNGWDFLEEYNDLSKNIKDSAVVIFLTTSLNPDDKKKAESFPIVKEFLHKPLNAEKFWKVVDQHFIYNQ